MYTLSIITGKRSVYDSILYSACAVIIGFPSLFNNNKFWMTSVNCSFLCLVVNTHVNILVTWSNPR